MVLLMAVSFAFAQEKNVKEAKSIAGEVKPDFAKAEQLINEALTNPETKDNAATWDVAGYIQKRINEKEMENAYLRKPYDTLILQDKTGDTGCEDLGAWFCWNRRVRFTGLHSRNG